MCGAKLIERSRALSTATDQPLNEFSNKEAKHNAFSSL
jgi:hypothetical protein